jgi:hypothetical protein
MGLELANTGQCQPFVLKKHRCGGVEPMQADPNSELVEPSNSERDLGRSAKDTQCCPCVPFKTDSKAIDGLKNLGGGLEDFTQ